MPKFTIFHPIDSALNHKCLTNIPFEEIGTIEAFSIVHLFGVAQNFNRNYAKFKTRSMSVGDIVMTEDNKYFMLGERSFVEIAPRRILSVELVITEHTVFVKL